MIPDLGELGDPSERAKHMNALRIFDDIPDFSLVLGGPLYQLFRRAHLSGDATQLVHRRILTALVITWLPLLILSLVSGFALGTSVRIPFLHDLETQARFLVAVPLLLLAEPTVHVGTVIVVRRFLDRRLVAPEDLPAFKDAVDWGMRVRNSVLIEIALMIVVWTAGQWIRSNGVAFSTPSWYAIPHGTGWKMTPAGYWASFMSIPIFQFLLLRWYVRLLIWYGFLWRVSKLTLRLTSTHPDRMGGLSFLGKTTYAFAPILVAQGALLSGLIASRVRYDGAQLASFKLETGGLVGLLVFIVFGPLLVFSPQLAYAKRRGLGAYGLLASQYVQEFEDKWIRRENYNDEPVLGSSDIQSLADLGNSYAVVHDMRIVPFGLDDLVRVAAFAAAPLLPLALLVFSLDDLIRALVKILL